MRAAHTVEQVRAAEAALMARLPDGTLMQRAAAGLAYAVIDYLGGAYGRRVVLLVGSGDNGGDALYAGAQLARRGASVEAWLLSESAHEGGVAALRRAGGRTRNMCSSCDFDVVIDGVTGIGGRGPLREPAMKALAWLKGIPVVAVDVPSGVGVDSGEVPGPHVDADLTVTFGTHKVAHLVDPAAAACGAVHLVDIGLDLPVAAVEALQDGDVARLLRVPRPADHKYTRGVVGLRTGSDRYPGAALLSVAGANCGLAGMVRYVGSAAEVVKARHPEVVGGGRVQAWVVGSGTDAEASDHLREALADGVPVVVDADALRYADQVRHHPAVLTPHAGELAEMLGEPRQQVEARSLAMARRAATAYDAVVLLKGSRTLVAAPDGRIRVNTTGTPWLATAGAGDVLAGLVGALLATCLDELDAASVGAWLHGSAATLAAARGPLTATRVAAALPATIDRVIDRSTWVIDPGDRPG